jgi:carboxylesterase type B
MDGNATALGPVRGRHERRRRGWLAGCPPAAGGARRVSRRTAGRGRSGVEIPFLFETIARQDTHPRIGDAPAQGVADSVHGAWVSFVTDGTPGWRPYTTRDRTTALPSDKVDEVDDPAHEERVLWDGIR